MLNSTRKLIAECLSDAQLVFIFGYTPWATYIHVDGIKTIEITEDHDFQRTHSARWTVIEVLESGGYKITSDSMIDADNRPLSKIVRTVDEVIDLLS